MKKILIPSLVVGFLMASVLSSPAPKTELESKSTSPVVAANSAEYNRQMASERASRERVRAAVDKHKAEQAKIAKAKALAKKKAALERKRQARLAAIKAQKAAARKAAERKKAEAAQRHTAYPKPVNKAYSGGSPKAYALGRVGAAQFACLDSLWMKESGWNYRATNPSSGAYGIPQSLPASKMASAGADYLTNPITQVKWGLGYINSRYGSPCNAWAHSQSVGWY